MSSLNAPLSLASSSPPLHAFSGLTKAVVLNSPFLCNSSHCDNSIYWHVSEVLPFFLRNLMVHFNVPSLSSEHRRSKWQITKSGCKRLEGRIGGWVGASAGNLFKIIFRASAERVQELAINLRYIYKRFFTSRQPRYTVWRLVED